MVAESLYFSVITAILGMSVVFIFLGIFCLIMIILKFKIKDIKIVKYSNTKTSKKYSQNKNERKYENRDIKWLAAALLAYLEIESQITSPTAVPWAPNKKDNNSWVIINRIGRNGIY